VYEWPFRNRQVRERCHEALQAMDLAFSLNESESAQTNFYHEKEQDQFLESFKVNCCNILSCLVYIGKGIFRQYLGQMMVTYLHCVAYL
jgi:hypothetical protein